MTLNIDEELLKEAQEAVPGANKTELVHQGLRALVARQAAERLAATGSKSPRLRRAKRSAWTAE